MKLLTALLPLLSMFIGFVAIGWYAQRAATSGQKVLRFITGTFLLATTSVVLLDGRIIAKYIVSAVFFGATALVVERRYRAKHPQSNPNTQGNS